VRKVRTSGWSAGPGCHGGCGIIAHIKDGKLLKVEGDPDHPWNQGRLCARALSMTQYVDHPDRLTKPLKRMGERGENKWCEISWEEAFDLIETRMKKIRDEYGAESMVFSSGTGRDIYPWLSMLAYAYGSPNVMFALSGNACYFPRVSACQVIQGDYMVFDAGQFFPDRMNNPSFKQPECIVIWGYNIPNSCPDNLFGHWIIDLMKRGTKIICMDPRLSWFASRSEHWLQLRPGTDAAMAMGFLNVIVNEGLYDHKFVEQWTNSTHLLRTDIGKLLHESDLAADGSVDNFVVWNEATGTPAVWDVKTQSFRVADVRPLVDGKCEVRLADGQLVPCETVWTAFRREIDKYPLDRVAEITRVPADKIAAAARFYAKASPAAIHWGCPIDMTPNMTPTAHAIAALWSITGNLEIPGGNVIVRPAYDAVAYSLPGRPGVIAPTAEMDEKRIATDRYDLFKKFTQRAQTDVTFEQMQTGKPYPIKGLWTAAGNLMGGLGMDPKGWAEIIKKLDFVVAVDLFHTPTTQLADVVLPAASFLEKDSVRSWWMPLQSINKAMTVEGCKGDLDIGFELAKRFDPNFRWENTHQLFDEIVKPSGMTYAELQEKVWAYPPEGHSTVPYRRHEKGLLRPDGTLGFNTPSGKMELYSTHREKWGLEPMPLHEEPPFTPVTQPEKFKEYPLILSTGRRSPVLYNSEHRQIPWLRALDPDPTVEIHPTTAGELGIGNGDWVWIENWFGKCIMKAKVTIEVPTWMVMAAHSWWFPEKEGAEPSLHGAYRSSVNQLIPNGYQGKDGLGAPIKHGLCKVYKASSEEIANA
jgi:anaerobic selenocysteine-containing dehydrogenase